MPGRPRGRPRHGRRPLPRTAPRRRRPAHRPAGARLPGGGGHGAARLRPGPGTAGVLGADAPRAGHHRPPRVRLVLPHRRPGRGRRAAHGHPGRRARLRRGLARQPPARHRPRRPGRARAADGAVPVQGAGRAARHRHRRGVRAAPGGLPRDHRPLRHRAGRHRRHAGDVPGAPRHPRRGRRPVHGPGRDRPDRQVLPAHPGPRRPRGAGGTARAEGAGGGVPAGRRRAVRQALGAGRGPGRTPARCRHAPLRRPPVRRLPALPYAGRADQRGGLPDGAVRQGRRGGPRAAQAGRARGADAVGDGARGRRGGAGDGRAGRPGRRAGGGPGDVPDDPVRRDAGLLPDRVAGPAGPGGAAAAVHLPRPRRRHLALPARPGRRRHGAAVHRGPARTGTGALPARGPGGAAGGDVRGRRLPRADHRHRRHHDRLRTRRGGPGAARSVRPGVAGADQGVVRPARDGERIRRGNDSAHLGDRRGLRQLRLLQGTRRRLRGADVPVGVAEGPSPGRLLRRVAHPRPRHVPQAAAAGGRAAARGADPAAGREQVGGRTQDRTGV